MLTLQALYIPEIKGVKYEAHKTSPKRGLKIMEEKYDVKKWIICKEKGKDGYRHYHIRIQGSGFDFYSLKLAFGEEAHIEEEAEDVWEYEKKDGYYWASWDNQEALKLRFGQLNPLQREILKEVEKQNDRQIDLWYDPTGNHGKTWLSMHLWEIRQALVIPRAQATPEKISAFVCSAYRGQKYIIIDIPRSAPIKKEMYEVLEELKDGLVFDMRYTGQARNVRGAKIIVFTNKKVDLKGLSVDRWRIHGVRAEGNART